MQISILVEPISGEGFRAASGPPLSLEAAAATRAEAIAMLRTLIDSRVKAGAEIVTVELPIADHPLMKYVGMLKDDPMLPDWIKAMEEYRRERDAEDLIEDAG